MTAREQEAPGPRIALLGSRGIPARYGGYETLLDELAVRLVERGWRPTVYCRSHYTPKGLRSHNGVRLVVLPTLRTKYFDTPAHTLLSALHTWTQRYDVALVVNSANALFVPLLRARGIPTALHVDGIEKRRAKWGAFGRFVYGFSERLAGRVASRIVTDAEVIRGFYRNRHGVESTMIRYGVEPRPLEHHPVLEEQGLEPRKYVLYVSRFEPENHPLAVVEAFRQLPEDLSSYPLVMVGDAPYATRYVARVKEAANDRTLFLGGVYGDGYRALLSGAYAYVQATEVGGTHPALVEAMGYGNCILANDVPEHHEVVGRAGLFFDAAEPATLTDRLAQVLADAQLTERLRKEAGTRAAELFDWSHICDQYEELFASLTPVRP